jgi:hypothetical protein
MAQTQERGTIGSAGGASMPLQRDRRAPQDVYAEDDLLDAIRRRLVPDDPIARLLAQLPAAGHTPPHGEAVMSASGRATSRTGLIATTRAGVTSSGDAVASRLQMGLTCANAHVNAGGLALTRPRSGRTDPPAAFGQRWGSVTDD